MKIKDLLYLLLVIAGAFGVFVIRYLYALLNRKIKRMRGEIPEYCSAFTNEEMIEIIANARQKTRQRANAKPDFDFSFYFKGQQLLVRPENEAAQRELDSNVAAYSRYIVRFREMDGSSFWLRPEGEKSAIFVKPGGDLNELGELLTSKGFKLARVEYLDKT